jgi:hypothetical protein
MWAKQKSWQSWAKKCAPVGMMVVVAGNLLGRSPATQPDAAPAHRSDGKLKPRKGNPDKGCGNKLKEN